MFRYQSSGTTCFLYLFRRLGLITRAQWRLQRHLLPFQSSQRSLSDILRHLPPTASSPLSPPNQADQLTHPRLFVFRLGPPNHHPPLLNSRPRLTSPSAPPGGLRMLLPRRQRNTLPPLHNHTGDHASRPWSLGAKGKYTKISRSQVPT